MKLGLMAISGFILLLIIGPVVERQLNPTDTIVLHGPSLDETAYETVTFHNDTHNLELAGMLFLPQGDGPFPGVVMIHGSGFSSRRNTWYLSVADYMQKQGVAVLLPDKRGSELSEGDWRTASYEDLATDTVAAVDYLQTRPEVTNIGVIGMSQGGTIAPIVATMSSDVQFVVNVVGSSLPAYDILRYEETHNLREMGFLPGVSDLFAYASSFYITDIGQTDLWDVVGNYDPLPYWEAVTVPTLVLYGADDTNVPATASAERLETLNQPNITINIYPNSGHALEDRSTGQFFREDALAEIRTFVAEVTQ